MHEEAVLPISLKDGLFVRGKGAIGSPRVGSDEGFEKVVENTFAGLAPTDLLSSLGVSI